MCIENIDLTLVKDIILIVGSLTATIFTIRSFSKWKKEHKGKLKYELSRNLLKSVYDLRDDFKGTRSPMIWSHEFSSEYHSKTKESEKYKYVFENRLKYLQNSYNSFLSLLPEIEIDCDSEINDLCKKLVKHITDYHLKVNEFIQLVDNWDLINNPYHKELNSTIFNNGKNNQTTITFNETVDKLTKELLKEINKFK